VLPDVLAALLEVAALRAAALPATSHPSRASLLQLLHPGRGVSYCWRRRLRRGSSRRKRFAPEGLGKEIDAVGGRGAGGKR
jgi:hypothetical protein